MSGRKIRVLIVDDSAFARKVIREVVSSIPDVEIVGIARDGLDALEQCALHKPDVLTLDLMMPDLDGIGVLQALSNIPDGPQVVVVSSTALDSRLAVEALQLGAIAIVQKPTALATDRLYEVGQELIRQVRVAATATRPSRDGVSEAANGSPILQTQTRPEVVVIGTSTGGPHALTRLFTALPGTLSAPVAAVVHIPVGFTASLAERLDRASALSIFEAREGLEVGPGMAVIARAGLHLTLERSGDHLARCKLSAQPLGHLHRPAVDVLFSSAAAQFGAKVLGVVLTGMGEDGLAGARAIRAAGGSIFTEDPASTVVDGMPRAVREAGLSNATLTLNSLSSAIQAQL